MDQEEQISAVEAANYAFQMTAELARMAREGGLTSLAKALELSNELAAQALADQRRGQPPA